jgi:hypothetical protein
VKSGRPKVSSENRGSAFACCWCEAAYLDAIPSLSWWWGLSAPGSVATGRATQVGQVEGRTQMKRDTLVLQVGCWAWGWPLTLLKILLFRKPEEGLWCQWWWPELCGAHEGSHSGEHDGLLELVAAMNAIRRIICTLYIDAKYVECDDRVLSGCWVSKSEVRICQWSCWCEMWHFFYLGCLQWASVSLDNELRQEPHSVTYQKTRLYSLWSLPRKHKILHCLKSNFVVIYFRAVFLCCF